MSSDLNAELVVLSACHRRGEGPENGEGASGCRGRVRCGPCNGGQPWKVASQHNGVDDRGSKTLVRATEKRRRRHKLKH